MKKNKILICLFFRNEKKYIKKSLSSIINQTYKKFDVVVLDDFSDDDSYNEIKSILSKNSKIKYVKNSKRMGYGFCYYYLFKKFSPGYKYFAWASGHDIYNKNWLKELYYSIKKDKKISVIYPVNDRIGLGSEFLREEKRSFQAISEDPFNRLKALHKYGTNFGQIIYGLFDVIKVRKAGITRKLNLADTVLIWELAIFGKIVQIKKKLLHFRFDYFKGDKSNSSNKIMSIRQKKNRFTHPPFYLLMPWPLINSLAIFFNYFFKVNISFRIKLAGIYCSLLYLHKYRNYIF
jgi:glycosyltransferase involved in cell wall biosynthesis